MCFCIGSNRWILVVLFLKKLCDKSWNNTFPSCLWTCERDYNNHRHHNILFSSGEKDKGTVWPRVLSVLSKLSGCRCMHIRKKCGIQAKTNDSFLITSDSCYFQECEFFKMTCESNYCAVCIKQLLIILFARWTKKQSRQPAAEPLTPFIEWNNGVHVFLVRHDSKGSAKSAWTYFFTCHLLCHSRPHLVGKDAVFKLMLLKNVSMLQTHRQEKDFL